MIFQDSGLRDRTAVVTGGSRGIGREIVRLLAEEGADVTFFYEKRKEAAESVQKEARDAGRKVTAVRVDVRDRDACERAIQDIDSRTRAVHVLVNNSGITRDNLLAALSEEEIREVLDTNLIGVFNVTRAVVPIMMAQRAGKIINITSVSGEKGGRGQVNYAASKGGVTAFTKAVAVELAPRRIQVNAVCPGVIETEMSRGVREAAGDQILSRILLKRYGKPSEVAAAVCFLASKHADYITGEILHVDGGFKMA